MKESDEIALKCTWVSKENIVTHFGSNNQVSNLSSNVTQWKQWEHSSFTDLLRHIKVEPFNGCICDPSVVIVADHDSLGRACCAAGVNEGTAIAGFLFVGSVLKFVLFFLGIVLCHSDFDQLVPCEYFAFHLSGNVFWNWVFPDDKVFDSGKFVKYFGVFFQLSSIFQNYNLTLRMICNILTGFWSVRSVDSNGKVMAKNGSTESDCPFDWVKADNVDSSIVIDS